MLTVLIDYPYALILGQLDNLSRHTPHGKINHVRQAFSSQHDGITAKPFGFLDKTAGKTVLAGDDPGEEPVTGKSSRR
jgi:hypothetical protein